MTPAQAAAIVRDGLDLLDRVDFVDDAAIEDGHLGAILADGTVLRITVGVWGDNQP